MQLLDGPFRTLQGVWSFNEDPSGPVPHLVRAGFRVPPTPVIAVTLGPLFEHAADRLVQSFCTRAEELY